MPKPSSTERESIKSTLIDAVIELYRLGAKDFEVREAKTLSEVRNYGWDVICSKDNPSRCHSELEVKNMISDLRLSNDYKNQQNVKLARFKEIERKCLTVVSRQELYDLIYFNMPTA